MGFIENCEAHCADPYCSYGALNEEHALWTGWAIVEGELFCPLHHMQARMKRQREALMDEITTRANEITARKNLDKGWYAAWDEFQSDLADFHRATGKHAHKNVRMMTPQQFRDEYRRAGRINVKNAHESAVTAENAWKEQMKRVL